MNKEKEIWIRCSCGSEVLNLEKEAFPNESFCLYLAIFNQDPVKSFKHRLRYIWEILWTGKPFNDNIVLDPPAIEKLKNFLNNL